MAKQRNGMSESEAGKLGAEKTKLILQKQKEERVRLYNLNPTRYCKQCGKPIDYEHRNINLFCNSSCAAYYTNAHRLNKEEIYKKQSESFKKYIELHRRPKKVKYCRWCGAEKGKCKHPEICKKHQIFKSLIKFGFRYNECIGTEKIYDEYNRVCELLKNFYIRYSSSDSELVKQFNYTSGSANFCKLLHSLDVNFRETKDSIRLAYLEGRVHITNRNSDIYKTEWHTTWDGREVFLRSSYESDYAKELDSKQIEYDVECFRIKYFDTQRKEYRCAIPDFYLKEQNMIVEVKSNYTYDEQNMKDKFKAYRELGYRTLLVLEHREVNI